MIQVIKEYYEFFFFFFQQIQHSDMLGDGIQVATMTTDSGEVLHIQQGVAVAGASGETDSSQ